MSVTAWLQHISVNNLQRMKQSPDIFRQLIMHLSPKEDDTPLILGYPDLTPAQIDILHEITPDISLIFNKWSIYNIENLEDLKNIFTDTYESFKSELYSILIDDENCLSLDLDRAWSFVSNIFRCGIPIDTSTVVSKIENCEVINIFSGNPVYPNDTLPTTHYQDVDEVSDIAESLSKIDEQEIRRRFGKVLKAQPPVYRHKWDEESYPILLEYCQDVQRFYKIAAEKGFGIVNAIG